MHSTAKRLVLLFGGILVVWLLVLGMAPDFTRLTRAFETQGIPPENEPLPAGGGGGGAKPIVTVVQVPSPNMTVRSAGQLVNTIVIRNWGKDDSGGVRVTMPFDASKLSLLDVQFSQPEAFVREVTDDSVTFQTGEIRELTGVVTATVRLAIHGGLTEGTVLFDRLLATGDGINEERQQSNLPLLVISQSDHSQSLYGLRVMPARGVAGSNHTFSSSIFLPSEPVTLWYNTPANQDVPVKTVNANKLGIVSASFSTLNMAPGTYSMVFRGNWSEFVAVGTFTVE